MMMRKVFTLNEVGEIPMNSIQQLEGTEAQRLITEGKAVAVDIPHLDDIERKIAKSVDSFRKKVADMKVSDDPVYKVDGAIDYYTDKLRAELETEVEELQRQYEGLVTGLKEAARQDLANKSDYISDTERKAATDIVNEAIASIKYGDGIGALDVLLERADYFNDTRKLALLKELARLADATTGHARQADIDRKIKSLYQKLNAVRDGELVPVKIAQALGTRGDDAFRQLRLTHSAFRDYKNNMHNGGRK
jgi:hypothetical protein